MIKKPDTWADLTSLWQEEKGIDAQDLAQAVRRKTWSMRIMMSTEILFGVFGVAFGIWLMFRNALSPEFGVGAFVVLFSAIGTYATVWARKGAWAASSSGVADQLRLTLERAHSGIKLALVNLWALIPATALVASVMYLRWEAIIEADPAKQREVILLIGLGALALIGTGVWAVWYKKRKQQEIERLRALLKDYEE